MTETIDVDAEVIESELSPLSKAEQWLATARGRVAELAAQYKVPESIGGERAYKDAKESRASVRKDAAELDAERKRMTREMDDALKRFRGDVKDVLEPLTKLDVAYKAALDEYEARWGAERRATLQEAYDEYAPYLVPLVPLDRLVARFGTEPKKGWLNRSTNVEAAKAGLRGAVDSIAAGEKTIEGAVGPEDLEAAKDDYFSTLDLGQAIAGAQARAEQRERVRRLEEERRATEESVRAAQARAVTEADPAVEVVGAGSTLFVADKPAPIIDTRSTMSREQYELELESVSQTPDYRPDTRREILNHMGNRTRLLFTFNEPLKELVLDVTPNELATIQAVFRNNDVHGKMRRVG